MLSFLLFFFCKQKTAYEMRISDWSSDVCSSDLMPLPVVTFSPEIEMLLNQAVRANPAAEWPFEHGMAMTIIEQVGQAVEPLLLQTRSFALVASPICRSALSRLVRATFPDVAVISYLEIPATKQPEIDRKSVV